MGSSTWQEQSDFCNSELEDAVSDDKEDCVVYPLSEQNRDSLVKILKTLLVMIVFLDLACYKWRKLANLIIIFESVFLIF